MNNGKLVKRIEKVILIEDKVIDGKTITVRLDATDDVACKLNRPDNVRQIPSTDPGWFQKRAPIVRSMILGRAVLLGSRSILLTAP